MRGVVGVKYSYTLELPPVEGSWGFIIPERKVEPIVTDTWKGIKALLFRLHSYTADRSEKLEAIGHKMEKRLRQVKVSDNISESKDFRENMLIPDSNMVPMVSDQLLSEADLLNILGFEDIIEDNLTENNKRNVHKMYDNNMKENAIYDTSTIDKEKMKSMKSGSAKLWSIGDTLRNQYNYLNSNFRK